MKYRYIMNIIFIIPILAYAAISVFKRNLLINYKFNNWLNSEKFNFQYSLNKYLFYILYANRYYIRNIKIIFDIFLNILWFCIISSTIHCTLSRFSFIFYYPRDCGPTI